MLYNVLYSDSKLSIIVAILGLVLGIVGFLAFRTNLYFFVGCFFSFLLGVSLARLTLIRKLRKDGTLPNS